MALLRFSNTRQLSIKIDKQPYLLHKGAGLHRLLFQAELDTRNTIDVGVPVDLRGQAWLGANRSDWLGAWFTDKPVVTQKDFEFPATFVLPLTDEQLAVIEQRRAGSDIQLGIDVDVVLGYDPAVATGSGDERWPTQTYQDHITIQGETWVRLLEGAGAGLSLAVVVPVPLSADAAARTGSHLREAIRKVNLGHYDDAVTWARKAVEATGGVWPAEDAITKVKPSERPFNLRLALLRQALFSLASPAAHDDQVAATFKWDREKALAVIAAVSALAACTPPPAANPR